jgi:hypothetical protein
MAGKGSPGHKGAKGGFRRKNAKAGASFKSMKGAKVK